MTGKELNPPVPPARPFKFRRILIPLAAVLATIIAVLAYVYFWQTWPIGVGPAGPAVPAADFAKPWTDRPVLLVGLGDSVTAGFGARRGYAYFDLLISNASGDFPAMKGLCLSTVLPHLRATNLSVSGSVSKELVDAQLPKLPRADTNTLGLVVITTGGNDLIHNYGRTPPRAEAMFGATLDEAKPWIDEFGRRLETNITELTARFPDGCHIFLATIYDPTDSVGDIQHAGLPPWPDGAKLVAAYNDVIRRCAGQHPNVHLVDLHTAFLGHGIHCTQFWRAPYDSKDPHYWYYGNLEDPNERGYDAIRRLFLIEMAKTLGNLGP